MSITEMHKMWRDSTPAVTFPFKYKSKEGIIQQSWKDVREKLNRDASNTALTFSTGHIAPSCLQNIIVSESTRRENVARATHPSVARQRERDASTPLAPLRASTPAAYMSESEFHALYDGEGGGRSRKLYLKLRRDRPIHERFAFRATTQQVYGWEQSDMTTAAGGGAASPSSLGASQMSDSLGSLASMPLPSASPSSPYSSPPGSPSKAQRGATPASPSSSGAAGLPDLLGRRLMGGHPGVKSVVTSSSIVGRCRS